MTSHTQFPIKTNFIIRLQLCFFHVCLLIRLVWFFFLRARSLLHRSFIQFHHLMNATNSVWCFFLVCVFIQFKNGFFSFSLENFIRIFQLFICAISICWSLGASTARTHKTVNSSQIELNSSN